MTYHERIERFRARLLARAIRITKGNTAAAAALLGLDRTYVYRALKRYGIKHPRPVADKTKKNYFGVPIEP